MNTGRYLPMHFGNTITTPTSPSGGGDCLLPSIMQLPTKVLQLPLACVPMATITATKWKNCGASFLPVCPCLIVWPMDCSWAVMWGCTTSCLLILPWVSREKPETTWTNTWIISPCRRRVWDCPGLLMKTWSSRWKVSTNSMETCRSLCPTRYLCRAREMITGRLATKPFHPRPKDVPTERNWCSNGCWHRNWTSLLHWPFSKVSSRTASKAAMCLPLGTTVSSWTWAVPITFLSIGAWVPKSAASEVLRTLPMMRRNRLWWRPGTYKDGLITTTAVITRSVSPCSDSWMCG